MPKNVSKVDVVQPVKSYRWKTPYNAHLYPKWAETNTKPSMTVPDMAMSIEEIIARSARGLKLEHMLRVPIYEGETEFEAVKNYMPDVLNMDPVDQQEYKRQIDQQIAVAKERKKKLLELALKAKQKKKADQGSQFSAQPVEDDDVDPDDQPAPQYPKKTRGAGAAPRDDAKGTASKTSR